MQDEDQVLSEFVDAYAAYLLKGEVEDKEKAQLRTRLANTRAKAQKLPGYDKAVFKAHAAAAR